MTLVLCTNLGGSFAVMTSDTRRVRVDYEQDSETGAIEIEHSKTVAIPDVRDIKTHKLNDYILVGAGGNAGLATYLVDILKRKIKEEHDMSHCKEILDSIIERELANKEGPEFLSFLDVKEGVSVILSGFYRDGSTGLISFMSGEGVDEQKASPGYMQNMMITPAIEYLRRIDEMFKPLADATYENVPADKITGAIFQDALSHATMLHGVISYNHPVEISPDFEIHILALENGKPRYSVEKYDLSEAHKHYAELEKQV